MDKHGISNIPVLTAEDAYDLNEEIVVGFCGEKKTNDKQCLQNLSIVLDNDENTYNLMADSFALSC